MKTLLNEALKVADACDVYVREIESTSIAMTKGVLKQIQSEKKTEIALRIVKNGLIGTAVSTDLKDSTLIDRAIISLENQGSEAGEFSTGEFKSVNAYSLDVAELTVEELVDELNDLNDRIKEKAADIDTKLNISRTIKTVKLINSAGFEGQYDYTNVSLGMSTLTSQGFHGASKSYSSGIVTEVRDHHIDELINHHRLNDKKIELNNEVMPVIFAGKVMGSLMLRVLAGVNGGNIVKGISPLVDKIGQQVFSDKLSIRDVGIMSWGCNTMAFDDEGTATQSTPIYENGVLKNYLLNIDQAKKLDMKATGNAIKRSLFSKEIEDAPAIFDTNMLIEGENVADDLLIKGVKRGLLITGVMGAHTGNMIAGNYSMNISSGFLIEDGKLTGKVQGAMIAGNIYDLFKSVEAIGTEYEVMHSIFYPMGYAPMVKFSQATIVGK